MNDRMTIAQIDAARLGDRIGSVRLGCTSYTEADLGVRPTIGSPYQSVRHGACTIAEVETGVGGVSDISDHDTTLSRRVYCLPSDHKRAVALMESQKANAKKFAAAEAK
jgi:hypothetical protein